MHIRLIGAILFFLSYPLASLAGTFTAASCNQSDVNSVINGTPNPIHVAVDGDTIQIPAGSCTWSAGVTVPSGIGITIIGSGTPNTSPSVNGAGTVNTTLIGGQFNMTPTFGNSLSRISTINFLPGHSLPIDVNGTCTASGCPNLRLDNLFFPTNWELQGLSDGAVAFVANVFGVADHNTVGDTIPTVAYVCFLNLGNGSWKGVGFWGDSSWASANTFGTNQTFFLENNIFNYALGTDTDISGSNGGGARLACRFNSGQLNFAGFCSGHGTDTTGRPRGVMQWEGYWNTIVCPINNGQNCGSLWPGRSGTGVSFANTVTNGTGQLKGLNVSGPQRRWRPSSVWGPCDGSSVWDTNDGTTYFSGSILSFTANPGPGTYTVTVNGSPGWIPNQWVSFGNPYSFHDTSRSVSGDILSNTANVLVVSAPCQTCVGPPSNGDGFQILRATVCLDQSQRGAGALLGGNIPPTPSIAVNQVLVPTYQGDDTLPTTATVTISSDTQAQIENRDFYSEAQQQIAQTSPTFPFNAVADTELISGWTCSGGGNCSVTVPSTTNFQVNAFMIVQAASAGTPNGSFIGGGNKIISKTSTTLTFAGTGFTDTGVAGGAVATTGSGHGTLANRPTTCSVGVGYFATDQGTWNTSTGTNAGKQGVLYTCTSANTWTLSYTPFTYPHPLITGAPSNPGISFSPGSVGFGNQTINTTSAAVPVQVSSTGTANLTVTAVTVNTPFSSVAVSSPCPVVPFTLTPGSSCNTGVAFTPTALTPYSGTLTVSDNVPGSPQTVALTGTGTLGPPINLKAVPITIPSLGWLFSPVFQNAPLVQQANAQN